MAELEQLQQHIPSGQQVLRQHHRDLQRVAEYCESNYLQASDQRQALEETMALSAQSLASVSFQVSSLASAFLRLLELRAAELRRLEADISCVAQRVEMHKEKVSRREIGSLTVTKRFPSCQTVVPPPSPPCLEPYCRKPLNFSVLDDIGHGVKDHSTRLLSRTGTLARKGTKSPAQAAGTLGRSPRIPEPVRPPVVPEGRGCAASSSLISISSSGAPGEGIIAPPPPPPLPPSLPGPCPAPAPLPGHPELPPGEAGGARPGGGGVMGTQGAHVGPSAPIDAAAPDDLELPPPPPPALFDFEDVAPLPPPPAEDPPWAPQSYVEKVVALYPYTQQKDNELSFQPGALLFVTRRHSDGWCEGVMGQEVGFFPGNYVEPL
ncbi:ABI gene family member 3 isoform X2 [Melopsittacus undulatus]|uniref:ABI gene family member 3 isoform X2 n=1 Tax=Melopsittacus undulatus TaxID=13146 RepID=UPI00146BEF68|nr:ABI gene family member 3 isoform X2 [Melopsittacus undulatus]